MQSGLAHHVAMIGMHAQTGKALGGIEHCKQSVRDILTTPKVTRVMRRTYGSDLFELTDAPTNASTRMDLIAATAEALARWEPRIDVQNVTISVTPEGQVVIDVSGNYLPDGVPVRIDGIVVN